LTDEVLVIPTGGTIVSVSDGEGLSPDIKKTCDLLQKAELYFGGKHVNMRICRVFGNRGYDSSDIGPDQWLKLSEAVMHAIKSGIKGILILHGTDTMAYTSAWLSLCFNNENIPVVLTGSQRGPDTHDYDGWNNLLGASEFMMSVNCGVWLYFNGRAYRGDSVHKSDAERLDAFTGKVFTPPAADNAFALKDSSCRKELIDLSFISRENQAVQRNDIALLHMVPGLEITVSGNESILIIEGYGAGNMPQSMHCKIKKNYPGKRKPQIIACSQAENGFKDPEAYSGVGIGELSRSGFDVWSQGDRTMEFICALSHFAMLSSYDAPENVLKKFLDKCIK